MLIDIGLPGMNGYDLAAQIRHDPDPARRGPRRPHRLRAGGGSPPALLAGFDHHLVKPVEVDHIQRLLAELSTANAAVS